MKFLKAHWPWIVATLGGILTDVLPGLTAIAASHPKSTVGILCGAIVAVYNMTAPKDRNQLGK